MIQNITEAQARQYLTVLFYRLGFNDDESERVINVLPERGYSLQEYVKALDSEARKYHGHKKPTMH